MACDLRATDGSKALNSHCGCGLGSGHTPASLVSMKWCICRGDGRGLAWGQEGGSWDLPIGLGCWAVFWAGFRDLGAPQEDWIPQKVSEPLASSQPIFLFYLPKPGREGQGPLEILQLDFEMENFTSQSVKRRIMWHIDYRGHGALPELERAVTELTVIQRDVQAILPLAMVSEPVCGLRGGVGMPG